MCVKTRPLIPPRRYTYKLLVYMHEAPDPAYTSAAGPKAAGPPDAAKAAGGGPLDRPPCVRFDRYQDLTCHAFGPRAGKWALVPFQTAVLVGLAVTYTVVGSDDMKAVIEDFGHKVAPWVTYLAFGGEPPGSWRACLIT